MIGRVEHPYDRPVGGCRVLLVSDQRASDVLSTHLAHHGFTIDVATGAPGAAESAGRESPDVVLIDASIRCGWQEVVRALGDSVPKDHIAVLAAYWSTDARQAAARDGIGATLLKKVEGAELVNRLRSIAGVA